MSELESWRAAVSTWIDGHGDERRAQLTALKKRLHALKRFGASTPAARPFPSHEAFLGYISGFICAEGSFGVYGGRPRFQMRLRGDDRPLLELLAATSGFGSTYHACAAPPLVPNPSSAWVITARRQLRELVDLLREGGLRGRKRAEMEAWAVAVDAVHAAQREGSAVDHAIVQTAAQRLAEIREYRPAERRMLLESPRRDIRAESIAVLQEWSRGCEGPLSCEAYNRWRRDGMPQRNTIARAFRSWHAALAAAGLDERAAVSSATVDARNRGGAARRAERRATQRARVVAAVKEFERDHGRLPRAMEFFRWQRVAALDTPSQGSVYRLFPGGWAEVLAACQSVMRAAA